MGQSDRSRARRRRGDALALILAGGSGTRLKGLTEWCAKPAVPFGGHYRTIDFTLSNCINSNIRQIALLTQYKSQSLIWHVQQGWGLFRRELGEFIDIWPAQQRRGEQWYVGTVDAVHQNLDLIEAIDPKHVLVLAGDHVYAMDYSLMLDAHIQNRADITVACVEVPIAEAHSFGVVGLDRDGRVRSFVEKPECPQPSPGGTDVSLASMGIYIFNTETLFDRVTRDAADPDSSHDFGYSVLPKTIHSARVFAYLFRDAAGRPGYWRDVGTVDSYWSAHMDLLRDAGPKLDLFDPAWPIWTHMERCAPAQIGHSGRISGSILGQGSTIIGGVYHSVVGTNCEVGAHSRIKDSVLLPDVKVGRNCSLDRVVVDTRCVIPDNTVLTGDLLVDEDNYYVSPRGIVLVTRRSSRLAHAVAAARKVA